MMSLTTIGSPEEPYPMVKNIWEFFSEKGTKTVFVSVGTGNSCLPDLDLTEILGCPILKLDTKDNSQKWSEIKEILKTRKISEATSEFAKPASRKWVLPRNLLVEEYIPSYGNGTLQVGDETVVTKSWPDLIKNHCESLGLAEGELRIDILKIDSCPQEAMVLNSLWQSGFRPSLLLMKWQETPDSNLSTLLTAGHLQMLGYALVGKENDRFLYYYTDVNYYEVASWETVAKKFENPLMSKLIHSIYPGTEGTTVTFPLFKKESEA